MSENTKKMRASVGKTFNLGNYESARLDWSAEFIYGEDGFENVSKELLERMEAFAKEQGWSR